MSTVDTDLSSRPQVFSTVTTCYELLDVVLCAGVSDLTEGIYVGPADDRAGYLEAQQRQAEYLLDEARCGPGTWLLDIGCGYGRILEEAGRRGAQAVGITISPAQVNYCRRRGLTVHLLDYRHLGQEWDGKFDAVIANGSLEHFVQIHDAVAGRSDMIYEQMFAICRRLLRGYGRLVTTAIHFAQPDQVRPEDIQQGPFAHPRGSPEYHFAMVQSNFGGWYPAPGQLERCAQGFFRLVRQEDGTEDYHRTSEYWLRRTKWSMAFNPRVWLRLALIVARYPRPAVGMLRCCLWDQSWHWQFRPPAPTRLLRQTWEAV